MLVTATVQRSTYPYSSISRAALPRNSVGVVVSLAGKAPIWGDAAFLAGVEALNSTLFIIDRDSVGAAARPRLARRQ